MQARVVLPGPTRRGKVLCMETFLFIVLAVGMCLAAAAFVARSGRLNALPDGARTGHRLLFTDAEGSGLVIGTVMSGLAVLGWLL